jgi:hypothetical protein
MRNRIVFAGLALIAASLASTGQTATCGCGHTNCTGEAPCCECVPACKSSWDEKKTKKPVYSMKCEYSCERAREPWHTECRCSPPCGEVFVKKKLYKREEEKVEKVPKYEVKMVPAPCDHCERHPCCCHRWYDLKAAVCRLFGL